MVFLGMGTKTNSHGTAIVQNVFEATHPTPRLGRIGADNSTGTPYDNILIWHNVFVGNFLNLAYNDVGSINASRKFWSIRNNIIDDFNTKSDTFFNVGEGKAADAARIGNWPVVNMIGCDGNLIVEATGITAAGLFAMEYPGVKTIIPPYTGGTTNGCPDTSTFPMSYPAFVDRKSNTGSPGAGNGDYRLQVTSPAIGLPIESVISYDLDGLARAGREAAGAYRAP